MLAVAYYQHNPNALVLGLVVWMALVGACVISGICGAMMLNEHTAIAAVPRNSHGRFGGSDCNDAQIYLAGPATVAAAAIAGRIIDPREVLHA